MNYSRRQLYALGETLGDSVTCNKVGGGRIYGGGGGGGGSPGPSTTTSYNTNIPEYAQPYVENMMNAAQSQIYNKDMTGFNQYNPYSNNPEDYVAGFSPLQQQAQSSAANMQVPGQYGAASQLAGASGRGALGTVGQANAYGQQGSALSNMYGNAGAQAGQQAAGQSSMYGMAGYGQGQQGAQIGQSLGQQSQNASTGPGSVASYMNPYLQNSLNPQLQLANQQYGIAGQQQQGAATSAGAFGGSRSALANSLNQQNQMLAQNQIIGQGYNQAYNNAQNQMNTANQAALAGNAQAQQGIAQGLQGAGQAGSQAMQGYGMGLTGANQAANIGLQGVGAQQAGYGAANTAASNLANIGGQQLNAQTGIANLQNTMGGQQQAQQQQIMNQAIQNYATAQQYPYMQLGVLNSMLRGLPMQSTTTASYQAQPSIGMQATGLLGAAGSLYGKTAREGGSIADIKKMRSGGITEVPGYRYGTVINEPQLESMAGRMDDTQLNKVKGLPGVTPDERNTFDSALINNNYVRSNPEAGQMIAQAGNQAPPPPPQQPAAPTDRMSGIAQAGGGMFNSMGSPVRAAGGGIVAFSGEDESLVDQQAAQAEKDAAAQDLANKAPAKVAQKAIAKDTTKEQTRADYLKENQDMMRSMGINPDIVSEKGKAYQARMEEQQAGISGKEDQLERMAKAKAFLSLTQPTGGKNALGQLGSAATEYLGEKATNIKTIEDLKNTTAKAQAEFEAGNRAKAAGDIEAASKHFDEAAKLQNQLKIAEGNNAATLGAAQIHASVAGQATKLEEQAIQQYMKDHPGSTFSDAYAAVKGAGRGEAVEITRLKEAIAAKQNSLLNPGLSKEDRAQINKDIKDLTDRLITGGKPTAVAAAPAPVQNEDGTVTIPGKGTFKKLPNGNYAPV